MIINFICIKGVRSVNKCDPGYIPCIFPWSVSRKERTTSNSKCERVPFTPVDHLYNTKQKGLLFSVSQMCIKFQIIIIKTLSYI